MPSFPYYRYFELGLVEKNSSRLGNGDWGMGNGEWGLGNGEWGINNLGILFQYLIPSPQSLN
ncbi:hypothetical protein FACHB389_01810 [Nostoc calcicola FACHB-389]|nr:hypothetical protein FACHB389_01810 [Nostoc calcicola FACHB-389]